MKALKRYYSKKELSTLIFNLVILLIFILFTVNLMMTQEKPGSTFALGFILVFFTSSMILKEILNFIFQKAIYQLTVECDPMTAYETIKVLRKWDILKSYTISYVAFSSLLHIHGVNLQAIGGVGKPDVQSQGVIFSLSNVVGVIHVTYFGLHHSEVAVFVTKHIIGFQWFAAPTLTQQTPLRNGPLLTNLTFGNYTPASSF